MELVEEKALKTSFLPEMTSKSSQQAFCEDLWTGNGANSVSGDDFFVDGLLDFSNDDVEEEEEEESEEEKGFFSVSSQCQNSNFSVKDDFASLPESELSVPADDLENLEWLSHFVDDSFLDFSLQYLEGPQPEKTQTPKQSRSEPDMVSTPMIRTTSFRNSVPSKARSKRSRTGGRVWSLGSLSFTESSSSSSSSSSSISSPSSRFSFSTRQNLELLNHFGKPAKKQKKKPVLETGSTQPQRRCSHCGVQKTPQWRTGPLGAKTLCNACGVRYKSGRLLPEYRPACSPTFLSEVHSNNHRKVLEMRRKKETVQLEYGLEPAVQSF